MHTHQKSSNTHKLSASCLTGTERIPWKEDCTFINCLPSFIFKPVLVWQSHYTCHLLNAIHCHVWIWEGNLICSVSCWELTGAGRGHPCSWLLPPEPVQRGFDGASWAPWHILLLLLFNLHWWSPCVPCPLRSLVEALPPAHTGPESGGALGSSKGKTRLCSLKDETQSAPLLESKADTDLLCPDLQRDPSHTLNLRQPLSAWHGEGDAVGFLAPEGKEQAGLWHSPRCGTWHDAPCLLHQNFQTWHHRSLWYPSVHPVSGLRWGVLEFHCRLHSPLLPPALQLQLQHPDRSLSAVSYL